jgi:hypothetical protein
VEKNNGNYSFDFSLVGKWIEMCDRIGIKYFEISHLFTQWGAKAAPKIMATVDGEYRKIFGWETKATDSEYADFLRLFLKEFLAYMKSQNGADKRCYFHISDEPEEEHLESYLAAKAIVAPVLEGYPIMDALSNYEIFASGVSEHPIAMTTFVNKFVEHGVKDLWTYYCGDQGVSNRFFAMPSARNRIIGVQLYKYHIVGFLHWGYNFYYSRLSIGLINPYINNDAEGGFPAGDGYGVYPVPGGVVPSIRYKVFYQGLQDMMAAKLLESICGREEVMKIIEAEGKVEFNICPANGEYITKIREQINNKIKEYVI